MSNFHKFDKSSSITSCDYDDEKKCMTIQFVSGAKYEYPDCDKAHYEALKAADSPGKHFHKAIRPLKANKL